MKAYHSCLQNSRDEEGLSSQLGAQFSIVLEGFKKKFLLLLGPSEHDRSAESGEETAHPRLGHDSVSDPGQDLPCVVCAVHGVESPSLWDSSLVVVHLS